MQYFMHEARISPASVYHILTNILGKQKDCAKWIPQAWEKGALLKKLNILPSVESVCHYF
jgi:hypothetical protein